MARARLMNKIEVAPDSNNRTFAMLMDPQQFKAELLSELRVELMALHLGDDMTVSEEDAARLLGVSRRTVKRMADAGEIPRGYVGRDPRYSLGMIRRLMRSLGEGNSVSTQ